MSAPPPSAATVRAALEGDAGAMRLLVDVLVPVVQARVARAAVRNATRRYQQRDMRQDIEDLTQEVFASLFEDDARTLRSWDPARGLSLLNFVGLVAEHQIASIFRSKRCNPWTEEPTLASDLDDVMGGSETTEAKVYSRELLAAIEERLAAEATPRGLMLFQLLLVEEQPVPTVCATMAMTADAVYTYRGRLEKLVRRIADQLVADPTLDRGAPQRSSQGRPRSP